jgi:hypothetical protein
MGIATGKMSAVAAIFPAPMVVIKVISRKRTESGDPAFENIWSVEVFIPYHLSKPMIF